LIPVNPLPPGGSITRVLCVDDNPDQADSEALFLRVLGFEARACYGGRDAIDLADEFLPDVCLLDLQMPGMDGGELAARLRDCAGARPLRMIAVTATDNDSTAVGFDHQLLKPVDPDRLRTVVNNWSIALLLSVPLPNSSNCPAPPSVLATAS
jgi:two-component system, OmpR family, response regulator